MKKQQQLGMNPSTASHKLVKDVLWSLIQETNKDICCKCKLKMTRENFSIEHVIPWLDSENPVGLFFDLTNIAFSHLKCNIAGARKYNKGITKYPEFVNTTGKSAPSTKAFTAKRVYNPDERRARYLRIGS